MNNRDVLPNHKQRSRVNARLFSALCSCENRDHKTRLASADLLKTQNVRFINVFPALQVYTLPAKALFIEKFRRCYRLEIPGTILGSSRSKTRMLKSSLSTLPSLSITM